MTDTREAEFFRVVRELRDAQWECDEWATRGRDLSRLCHRLGIADVPHPEAEQRIADLGARADSMRAELLRLHEDLSANPPQPQWRGRSASESAQLSGSLVIAFDLCLAFVPLALALFGAPLASVLVAGAIVLLVIVGTGLWLAAS